MKNQVIVVMFVLLSSIVANGQDNSDRNYKIPVQDRELRVASVISVYNPKVTLTNTLESSQNYKRSIFLKESKIAEFQANKNNTQKSPIEYNPHQSKRNYKSTIL